MSRLLDMGLEQLSTMLLKMGEMAEETVTLALESFLRGVDASERVRYQSEMLDGMSADIEDKAFELIAKYQPVASDLRTIKSYMKIAYDFERYGRYAWDISFTQSILAKLEKCDHAEARIATMTKKVEEMVQKSVIAMKNHDANMARSLAKLEEEVDQIYLKHLSQIPKSPPTTMHEICAILVVRYLERIADHATYVAESIVYIVTGDKILLR